jgi:ligand-binding sensor protein
MTPFDLKSREEWTDIVGRVYEATRMTATLTDDKGKHLLDEQGERFPLCCKIRENDASLTFICSQTNMAMLEEVKQARKPVIDECEAGLIRMVVPIFRDDVLIGQVTACGLAAEGEDEVDPFLISKQVGISEAEVEKLAAHTPAVPKEEIEAIADRFFSELNPS